MDGVKNVDENGQKEILITDKKLIENATFDLSANNTHESTVAPLIGLIKSNDEKPSNRHVETKIIEKPWRPSKYSVPEKTSSQRTTSSHQKRDTVTHPTWHKISKELHKSGVTNNAKGNSLNGFDVLLVDIPSSYSPRIRWGKPRMNAFTSPSLRYVPFNRSPTIFDLLLGFDSAAENMLTEPAEIEKELLIQQSLDNPYWNQRLSFGRSVNPAINPLRASNVDRVRKDVNVTQMFGKSTDSVKSCTCTCGEGTKV